MEEELGVHHEQVALEIVDDNLKETLGLDESVDT
jgi:hypothetical protein